MDSIRMRAWLAALSILIGAAPGLQSQQPVAPVAPVAPIAPGGNAGAGAAAAAPAPEVTMMRLRDGRILWGSIEAHDPEGLFLRRIDTGGRVRLPWGLLDPTQAHELELAWGYVDLSGEEVLVDAERLTLVDGREVIGLVVHRSDEALHLKTAQSLIAIPKARIAGPATTVQVPAFDIYSRDELYAQKETELAELLTGAGVAPEKSAEAHFALGQWCERILDFARAGEHYRRAAELSPKIGGGDLPVLIARATAKAQAQEQVDLLSEIELERKRARFDQALAACDDFAVRFPESPLLPDMARLRDRTLKSQERALREEVVKRWHFWSGRLARAAAAKLSFAEAVDYAGGKMTEEVAEAANHDLERIDADAAPDTARRLWGERKEWRVRKASYGLGTWLLGEDRARAHLGEQDEEKEEAAGGEKDEARKKLEEALKKYLQNQEVARKAQGGAAPDAAEDPEAFWKTQSLSARSQWILAYYAEFSGDMAVREVRGENCPECAGIGGREMVFAGTGSNNTGPAGVTRFVPCPTCHQVGLIRRVVYR